MGGIMSKLEVRSQKLEVSELRVLARPAEVAIEHPFLQDGRSSPRSAAVQP